MGAGSGEEKTRQFKIIELASDSVRSERGSGMRDRFFDPAASKPLNRSILACHAGHRHTARCDLRR
jgi:hypothetical protein